MATHHTDYTTIDPLFARLAVMRQARGLGEVMGSTGDAMRALLRLANVSVQVVGDTSTLATPNAGTLLVGDHRAGFEFAPLLAALAAHGRSDVHFVAKPFATTVRLMSSVHRGSDMLLPVIPGTLAQDGKNIWNRDIGWRMTRHRNLPDRQQLASLNAGTLRRSGRLLSEGRVVVIFPTGGVVDAMQNPWLPGLGTMLKLVPKNARRSVSVVFFRFDDFSSIKLARALMLQSYGVAPAPANLVMRISMEASVDEILSERDCRDAICLTERLRTRFVQRFGRL